LVAVTTTGLVVIAFRLTTVIIGILFAIAALRPGGRVRSLRGLKQGKKMRNKKKKNERNKIKKGKTNEILK
jgi:hypothetical protein